MHALLQSIFFFIPAILANSTASISSKIYPLSKWVFPMDFGYKLKGKRIFGSHKTIRGFLVGVFFSGIGGTIQYHLVNHHKVISDFNVHADISSSLTLGLLLGVGALFGDAIKSFFKRRVMVKPGKPWIPFDWIDYGIGAMIFSNFYYFPGILVYINFFLLTILMSPTSNILSKLIGIKDSYL